MKVATTIMYILDVLIFVSLIHSIWYRYKIKREIDSHFTKSHERLNTLSLENNKLRSQNEELKERLRNVGITYFD